MGLPVFREPEEVVVDVVAAKLDQAEAQQRSAIRRQPTVRHSRISAARERVRERIGDRYRNDQDRNAELQIAQMEAEIARLRNRRQRTRDDHNSRLADTETAWRDAEELLHTSRSFREEDSVALPPMRHVRLPRPDRQSSLRFEVGAPQSGSASPRRRRLLSPPSSSGSGRNIPDGPLSLEQDLDNLTPGFAPARYYANMDTRGMETPPPETWEASLPPLSRSTRRPDRPPHRGIDGLGDRYRSPSPDPAAEEETWTHLLTTMENGRSSANTSFASNGDSGSHSRESQTTVATSFGEIGADDMCDLDLPTGITEQIARDIRDQHRSRAQRQRRDYGEPDGPIMTGEQGLRMQEARMRRLANDTEVQAQARMRQIDRISTQMQMIQHLVERSESRDEPFPDELWAMMGLDEPDSATGTMSSTEEQHLRTAEQIMQQLNSQREHDRDADIMAGDII